jgi:hypothetical protein
MHGVLHSLHMLMHFMAPATAPYPAALQLMLIMLQLLQLALRSACLRVLLQGEAMPNVWLQLIARCICSVECHQKATDALASAMMAQQTGKADA